MRELILKQLKAKKKATGGHCGTDIVEFNQPVSKSLPIIDQLVEENIVSKRPGIHGDLIFLIS